MADIHYPPRQDDGRVNKKRNRKGSFIRDGISVLFQLVGMLSLFIVVQTYFFATALVSGQSMEPTLSDGDYLVVNKYEEPERFDVIIFRPPDKTGVQYVKRVIGLPGDSIEYKNNELILNGKSVDEPYADHISDMTGIEIIEEYSLKSLLDVDVVPEGHYFVAGDNRDSSRDSRSFGFIDEESLVGIVQTSYEGPAFFK